MDAESEDSRSHTLSDLARQLCLHRHPGPPPSSGTHRRAAVLICIFVGDNNELQVILTQRSSTLSSHSGEMALPGGKMEESDRDEVATALREAEEEIGLDPSLVDIVSVLPFTMKNGMVVVPVLGLLFDKTAFHPTVNIAEVEAIFDAPLHMFLKNGMVVVPVLGLLFDKTAFHPTLNIAEVEAIFDAPLHMFLKNENIREVEREWMGEKYLLHYFDYKTNGVKFVIFALTAGILIETASMVYRKSPEFSEMKPNFWNKTGSTSTL